VCLCLGHHALGRTSLCLAFTSSSLDFPLSVEHTKPTRTALGRLRWARPRENSSNRPGPRFPKASLA
jgi:hypothetical protein